MKKKQKRKGKRGINTRKISRTIIDNRF
jgi:hypothetical protein